MHVLELCCGHMAAVGYPKTTMPLEEIMRRDMKLLPDE